MRILRNSLKDYQLYLPYGNYRSSSEGCMFKINNVLWIFEPTGLAQQKFAALAISLSALLMNTGRHFCVSLFLGHKPHEKYAEEIY